MVSQLCVHLAAFETRELVVFCDLWVGNDSQSTVLPIRSGAETVPPFARSPEGASHPESSASSPACS